MKSNFLTALCSLATCHPLVAGTVVLTSLPDDEHPLGPVTSLNGLPLGAGVTIRVGAFPGMSDDALLDAAATGGFAALSSSFIPFGAPRTIGEGAAGAAGAFEVALKQATAGSPLVGEEVTLLVEKNGGQEFLVARFKGHHFEADSDTGLEPLLSLHLADAKIIVGNQYAGPRFATSPAPERGSYASWIAGFSNITDPQDRLADADADGDGRSNFLEYATAGNPDSGDDAVPCRIDRDESGDFWVRFSRSVGIGGITHGIETSTDLATPWQWLPGSPELDPNPPVVGSLDWMRIRVPAPLPAKAFFRLNSAEAP
jgi:hypothetical protein